MPGIQAPFSLLADKSNAELNVLKIAMLWVVFECTEQGDELMTILSGRCRLIDSDSGEIHELNASDTLFVHDGSRVTWDIIEDVTKVFFGHKGDGF